MGDVYQTIIRYPFDAMDAVGSSMTRLNLIIVPMEIVELKNGSVVYDNQNYLLDKYSYNYKW